jgi:hypothetical protein
MSKITSSSSKAKKELSGIKQIIDNVGATEAEQYIKRRYTKPRSKFPAEKYNTYRANMRLEADCTVMIDVLFLPTAKFGFKYLLVAQDIATRKFDMVPLKFKDSTTVLKAFKKMINGPYISLPKYYLISDGGSEFKADFHEFIYDENIFHKIVNRGRHTQLAPIDTLHNILSRILNAYQNWTDIIDQVRIELNEVMDVSATLPEDLKNDTSQPLVQTTTMSIEKDPDTGKKKITHKFKVPKFKVGDMVYYNLDVTKNIHNQNMGGMKRQGDLQVSREPKEIEELVYMNGDGPFVRYKLEGLPTVSYTESQLRKKL